MEIDQICYPEIAIYRNIVGRADSIVFFVKECDRMVMYEEGKKRLYLLSLLSQDFQLWLHTFLHRRRDSSRKHHRRC